MIKTKLPNLINVWNTSGIWISALWKSFNYCCHNYCIYWYPLMYDYQEEANFVYNLDGGPAAQGHSQDDRRPLGCSCARTRPTAFLLTPVTWADIDVFGSGRLGAARSSPRQGLGSAWGSGYLTLSYFEVKRWLKAAPPCGATWGSAPSPATQPP